MKKLLASIFIILSITAFSYAQTKINPARLLQGQSGGGSLFLKTDNSGNVSFSNNLNGSVISGAGNASLSGDLVNLGQLTWNNVANKPVFNKKVNKTISVSSDTTFAAGTYFDLFQISNSVNGNIEIEMECSGNSVGVSRRYSFPISYRNDVYIAYGYNLSDLDTKYFIIPPVSEASRAFGDQIAADWALCIWQNTNTITVRIVALRQTRVSYLPQFNYGSSSWSFTTSFSYLYGQDNTVTTLNSSGVASPIPSDYFPVIFTGSNSRSIFRNAVIVGDGFKNATVASNSLAVQGSISVGTNSATEKVNVVGNGVFTGTLTIGNGTSANHAVNLSQLTWSNVTGKPDFNSLYLGISATAANSTLLNSQSSAFYLNSSNQNAGTLPDARLSLNVPLLSGNNTFTGYNILYGIATGTTSQARNEIIAGGGMREFYLTESHPRWNLGRDAIESGVAGITFGNNGTNSIYTGGSGVGSSSTRTLQFYTSNGTVLTERARISPNGNLLVGLSTDNNNDKIQVNGTISAANASSALQVINLQTGDARYLGINGIAVNSGNLNGQNGLYYRNASNLNAGTLADALLSTNIPRLNAANTFTNDNVFSGNTAFGGAINSSYKVNVTGSVNISVGLNVANTIITNSLNVSGAATNSSNSQLWTVGTAGALEKMNISLLPFEPAGTIATYSAQSIPPFTADIGGGVLKHTLTLDCGNFYMRTFRVNLSNNSGLGARITLSNAKTGGIYTINYYNGNGNNIFYEQAKKQDGSTDFGTFNNSGMFTHRFSYDSVGGTGFIQAF